MSSETPITNPIAKFQENRTQAILWLLDNMIWPILAITFVVFGLLLPQVFATRENLLFLLYTSAAAGALALAESLCLLSGNFDLSVGSIAGFSAMFTGLFLTKWFPGLPGVVGILVILGVGGFIGMLNGISIAYLDVNPFLQTLAFFIIFRGGVKILSTLSVASLPESYTYVGGGYLGPVPFAVVLILALFALVCFVLKYTRFGLAIYAVGGDEDAAAEAGINTKHILLAVFTLSGIFSGLAGLLFTGYLGVATPTLAENAVFPAFAASVIGGISLFGGRGNMIGAFGGVLLLTSLEVALVQLQVDPNAIQTFNGIVLLAAILLYTFESKIRTQVLSA